MGLQIISILVFLVIKLVYYIQARKINIGLDSVILILE